MNLSKITRTRGTPAGTNRGLPAGVLGISCGRTDRKGHFGRDTGRLSLGHPVIRKAFKNFIRFFRMRLFEVRGGGIHFEPQRGRDLLPPPSFIRPPPLEGPPSFIPPPHP